MDRLDRLEADMIELDLDLSESNTIKKEDFLRKTQEDSASHLLNILEEEKEKKMPSHKSVKVSCEISEVLETWK